MELLSPAGSFDCLVAAVKNGADAVYFGGSLFNARLNAANFSDEDCVAAFEYCHLNNVKAYITMNTLVSDKEMYPALNFAKFLYENGADAVIVQDLGLVQNIRKALPNLPVHASTQMCVSSLGGVEFCKHLGVERVVLSRELSIDDISYIYNKSDMPLECFVHGAMCASFSGQCLFSSMVGGRSGNRGSCAQPCRKRCSVSDEKKHNDYSLSMADMCMLEHIGELRKAGVASLKVEGRMKKPEYVAAVTYAYRRAIDGAKPSEIAELKSELFEVFNRGEFSTGYYFGDGAKTNRVAEAKPSAALVKRINSRTEGKAPDSFVRAKTKIDMALTLIVGEESQLTICGRDETVTVKGAIAEAAKSEVNENTRQRYAEQLRKLGDTTFEANSVTVSVDGAYLPVSAINELRRKAAETLSASICGKKTLETVEFPKRQSTAKRKRAERPKIIASVIDTESALTAINAGADEISLRYGFFTVDEVTRVSAAAKIAGDVSVIVSLPPAIIGNGEEYVSFLESVKDKIDAVEVNNVGQIEDIRKFSDRFFAVGGTGLNVYNSDTAAELVDLGLRRLTLSTELSSAMARDIAMNDIPCVVNVFGRSVLMNLFHCPIKENVGCENCGKRVRTLVDEGNRRFPLVPVKTGRCMTRLLNCYPTDIISLAMRPDANFCAYELCFFDEPTDVIFDRIHAAISRRNGGDVTPLPDSTRGYWSGKK